LTHERPPISATDLGLAVQSFNPLRLCIAREYRGLTKAELAELTGKTASTISQCESGKIRPDTKTLASIALALGFPVGFFARKGRSNSALKVEECHFRSLRSASQRDRRRLLAVAELLCDLIEFLESHVSWPDEHVSTVQRPVKSTEDIENCAMATRKAWGYGLGPIPNIVDLLESKGVLVAKLPSQCSEIDAFSGWHHSRPFVFLLMEKGSSSRTRYDAAHELGHLIMHTDALPGDTQLEKEANRFAGAFLLPKDSFIKECPRWLNWDVFYDLKKRWKVSVAALVRRAFDLDCISEASYRRAFVQLNQRGERTKELHEPPPEKSTLLSQSLRAIADELDLDGVANAISVPVMDLRVLLAEIDLPHPVSISTGLDTEEKVVALAQELLIAGLRAEDFVIPGVLPTIASGGDPLTSKALDYLRDRKWIVNLPGGSFRLTKQGASEALNSAPLL
jgi:Zn-dependent peptidase ImmA (M78 family)/transcriptional regulator with XRE-family HTH domain